MACTGISAVTMAQDEKKNTDTYKPEQGMLAIEVVFNPATIFNSNRAGQTFSLPSSGGLNQGIKIREYMGNHKVSRGTFLFGIQNRNVATVLFDSKGDRVDAQDSYFQWALQFRPGVEYHFDGTKRLSPYVGGELILGFGSNKYTTESLNASDEIQTSTIKNGTRDFNNQYLPWSYANGFSVGAGLISGFDYYIAENLFIGLEINYAFVYNKRNKVVVEVPDQETVETKSGSNWYFNPSAGANVRLGWAF